jgi:hypothetical protein
MSPPPAWDMIGRALRLTVENGTTIRSEGAHLKLTGGGHPRSSSPALQRSSRPFSRFFETPSWPAGSPGVIKYCSGRPGLSSNSQKRTRTIASDRGLTAGQAERCAYQAFRQHNVALPWPTREDTP